MQAGKKTVKAISTTDAFVRGFSMSLYVNHSRVEDSPFIMMVCTRLVLRMDNDAGEMANTGQTLAIYTIL